jgi:hypothetical protein
MLRSVGHIDRYEASMYRSRREHWTTHPKRLGTSPRKLLLVDLGVHLGHGINNPQEAKNADLWATRPTAPVFRSKDPKKPIRGTRRHDNTPDGIV